MPNNLTFWDRVISRKEQQFTINIGKMIIGTYVIPWEATTQIPAKGTIKPGTNTVSDLLAARVKHVSRAVKLNETQWQVTIQFIQPEAYA